MFEYVLPKTYTSADASADEDAAVGAAPGLRLLGYAMYESGGTTALINIMHGATAAGGTLLVPVALTGNTSKDRWMWPGLDASSGISLDVETGQADICIYYGLFPSGRP